MPRTNVNVVVPGSTGTATAPTTADSTNNMAVQGFNPGMRIVFTAPASGTTVWTIKQLACPTCGIATDRTVSVASGGQPKVLGGLDPRLFTQSDGSLWLNPSQSDGTVYATTAG